jgi:hypothetical protein
MSVDDGLMKVSDDIHSVLSLNIDENLVLVGKKNLYLFNVVSQTSKFFANYRISCVLSVDDNNCYAIV